MTTTEAPRQNLEVEMDAGVLDWRFARLVAAGYNEESAKELAARADVDLGTAERLLKQGCPLAVALRILR